MIELKGCIRCGGDLDNTFEDDIHCIQCGERQYSFIDMPNEEKKKLIKELNQPRIRVGRHNG